MARLTQATTIILLVVIIFIIVIFFAFKGYTECGCKVKYSETLNAYYTDCPSTGTTGDFWHYFNSGWTGVCT